MQDRFKFRLYDKSICGNEIFFWSIAVPFLVFMNALGVAGAIVIIK